MNSSTKPSVYGSDMENKRGSCELRDKSDVPSLSDARMSATTARRLDPCKKQKPENEANAIQKKKWGDIGTELKFERGKKEEGGVEVLCAITTNPSQELSEQPGLIKTD